MLREQAEPLNGVQIRVSETPAPVVRLEGELDFENAAQVRDRLLSLLEKPYSQWTLNMSGCDYVDSSGMLALSIAAHQARESGRAIHLEHPTPTLLKMLQLCHLGASFGIARGEAPEHRACYNVDAEMGQWEVLRLVTPATPCACAMVRRVLIKEAAKTPLPTEAKADLELAVGEALANAVRHGSPHAEQNKVTVRILRGQEAMIVMITDQGKGFDRSQVRPPSPNELREGGMGIFYMETLMDAVLFESSPSGTTVRLVKLYPQQ